MSKPKPSTYCDFPNAHESAEGIVSLARDDHARVIRYIPNVVYANRDGIDLHLQILVPGLDRSETFEPGEGDHRRYPLVVFVQGSAWMEQDVYFNIPQLCRFAERGFVIASVQYRHSAIAPFPAQIQDCLSAVRFMQAHADVYKIEAGQTILWGDSSGAHTALMATLWKDRTELHDETDATAIPIDVCIDYYGPTDIRIMNDDPTTMDHDDPLSPEGLLIGGVRVSEHPQQVADTVIMNHIQAGGLIPPTLIMHGTKDRLVPFRQSILLYEKLKASGQIVEFYRLEESDHADPIVWSEPVLDLVESFVRRYLA